MSSTELLIRPAVTADAAAVAEVWLGSRRAAAGLMPEPVHPDMEVAAHLARRVEGGGVWVAERDGAVAAMLDVADGWLESLYVAPENAGSGLGSALLDVAKALEPAGFGLWVFESNTPARAFYRRHGLVELERTDGTANEERAPDIRMVWPGQEPLTYLRALMDEVDHDLAAVIARRVALTHAIQGFKPVAGHAGRDAAREQEIARKMAGHSPVLDEAAWLRIMHEVIGASLDSLD